MTTATQRRVTLDEYHRMIDAGELDDRHVELLNGEIVEMPPEGVPHASSSDRAERYIRKLLGDRAWLRVGKPITLPNDSEPEPDLCICENIEYDAHHPYPEDIFCLIEFSNSSLKKDLEVKPQTYAAAGIREYWVLNLKKMELTVFRSPTATGYQSEQKFMQGTIKPLAFQDVSIDVQRLLS
ncbi:Uma2 family endonuclease [Microcoleus sp. FACHB-1515]|uniref:Uma2 family endonuclease n=1 Tax=Cyanophyceae TaxID=3028117 RepID=UPI00168A1389|nr:Uma2 family endonuclease [Microcoleus sp. FACHB-1515]MBD2091837.1 Uma2 family endonuclease [Microcoleus sp. FACHB-1515]